MKKSGIVKWQGGKTSLLDEIIPRFPKEYKTYIEVFGGAGAVILNKKIKTGVEIYNDYNSDLVNLFLVVKHRVFEFVRLLNVYNINSRVMFLSLKSLMDNTPVPYKCIKENIKIANEMLPKEEANQLATQYEKDNTDIELMNAINFFKRYSFSFGGGGDSFNCKPSTIVDVANKMYRCSYALRKVIIENRDFEDMIVKFTDDEYAFYYCDPPYYDTENYYEANFNKSDHERLKNALANIKGKFLLSYNDCPQIKELYKDYYILEIERPNSMSNKKGSIYRELLIANYDVININPQAFNRQIKLNFYEREEEEWLNIM